MSQPDLPRACIEVANAAAALGLSISIRIMDDSTRTAQEAANACQCDVAQIVKSLVFRGKTSGDAILLLVSGVNRVDVNKATSIAGEVLERPEATFVRAKTGFAIGGIPPFGHATPMRAYADRDLLQYPVLYAAAGTPKAIFAIAPAELLHGARAEACEIAERR